MSFDDFSDLVEAHLMQEQEWTEIQVADFISPRSHAATDNGAVFSGVADGTRTHDDRNHNLMHLSNAGAGFRPIDGNNCPLFKHGRMRLPGVSYHAKSPPAEASGGKRHRCRGACKGYLGQLCCNITEPEAWP